MPWLVTLSGLTGTGKSWLAERLATRIPARVIRSDVVRKELVGLNPQERRLEPFGKGIYAPEFTERTYRRMLEMAAEELRAGRSVILDASFSRRAHRQEAHRLAERLGARFLLIECTCPSEVVRKRLGARRGDPSDGRWEIYQGQLGAFEPIEEPHLWVDTSALGDQDLEELMRALK